MPTIRVTTTVEIIESNGHAVTYSETSGNVGQGDNPGFFLRDVESGMTRVADKVAEVVKGRFGDLRDRDTQTAPRTVDDIRAAAADMARATRALR